MRKIRPGIFGSVLGSLSFIAAIPTSHIILYYGADFSKLSTHWLRKTKIKTNASSKRFIRLNNKKSEIISRLEALISTMIIMICLSR